MKKIISALLVIFMLFSFAACQKDVEESSNESSSQPQPQTEYDKAIALLNEGKAEEAYKALYAIEDDERATEKLKDFKLVYGKLLAKNGAGKNFLEEFKTYDDNGNLTEYKSLQNNGDYIYTYEYDKNNQLIKETKTAPDYTTSTQYEYNEKGERVKKIATLSDGNVETYTYTYTYNEDGLLVQTDETVSGPYDYYSDTETTKHTYDENGNIIKTVITTFGLGTHTHSYVYDEENRLTEHTELFEGRSPSSTYTMVEKFQYDRKGQKIAHEFIDNDGTSVIERYTYNQKGLLTRSSVNNYGTTFSTNYSYDEFGCLIKEIEKPDNITTVYADYRIFYCPDNK